MWGHCSTARSTTGHLPGKQLVGSGSAVSAPFSQAQGANPAMYGPRGTQYALPCAYGAAPGG